MKLVNVLIITPIGDECLRQIAGISPEIKIIDASDLARAEKKGDLASKEQLDALLAEAEVIYGLRLPQNVIARAPKLKWIQVMSAGVERFLDDDFLKSSAVMTSVRDNGNGSPQHYYTLRRWG